MVTVSSVISGSKVFVRELISNASDALEKFRYLSLTGVELENNQRPLDIKITADKEAKTLTIQAIRNCGVHQELYVIKYIFYMYRIMVLE